MEFKVVTDMPLNGQRIAQYTVIFVQQLDYYITTSSKRCKHVPISRDL